MHAPLPTSPAAIVRSARRLLKLNQTSFAASVGRTQTVISKYEAGLVDPPAKIIMHCMTIIRAQTPTQPEATADPRWAVVNGALAQLQDALQAVYAASHESQ